MSRILIVEDEWRLSSFLEKGLRANGFTTTTAPDGRTARLLASDDEFELMLLDLGLPDVDELDLLRELRRRAASRRQARQHRHGRAPRLTDLSIARSFGRAAVTQAPVGTDAYMPPEQCAPREIGPTSDVWGFGATLYHAVTGGVSFPRPKEARHSEDPIVRFPQLAEKPHPPPKDTPPALSDLILRALSERPADRPTAAQMVLELQPLVAALPRKLLFGRRGTRVR